MYFLSFENLRYFLNFAVRLDGCFFVSMGNHREQVRKHHEAA